MTHENTQAVEPQEPEKEQEPGQKAEKKARKSPKIVKVKNTTGRPITLIVTNSNKKTILPTETAELANDFMASIKKNSGAMVYFDTDQLIVIGG